MIEPQGPLPPEIYWRRRVVAVGAMVAVVVLVVGLVFWTTRGGGDPQNTANSTDTSAEADDGSQNDGANGNGDENNANGGDSNGGDSNGGTNDGGTNDDGTTNEGVTGGGPGGGGGNNSGGENGNGEGTEGGTPATINDASEICPDQNLAVVLYTDRQTYQTGEQPTFTLVATNSGLTKCIRDIGDAAQDVVVRTLDGTRTLWSARDCSDLDGVDNRELEPGQQSRNDITWTGQTSNPGCDRPRVAVPPGSYQAIGKIGEKESAPITFNVVAPAQEP